MDGQNITLEVPRQAGIDNIIEYADKGRTVVAIDGFGYSPWNGGRVKRMLDWETVEDSHARESESLFADIEKLNAHGVGFYLVNTNYIVKPEELEDERCTEIFDFMQTSSDLNGIIVVNADLENFVRENYDFNMVASCIKAFPEKKLTRDERIRHYKESCNTYDRVVLAPSDGFDKDMILEFGPEELEKIVPVLATPCRSFCNSYWHYLEISYQNRRDSFLQEDLPDDFNSIRQNRMKFYGMCQMQEVSVMPEKYVRELHEIGINNFKIGRNDPENDFIDMFEFFEFYFPNSS